MKYTYQSAFTKASIHLLNQGCRSVAENDTSCLYRANRKSNGRKRCAIGALIPNKQYDPNMEGKFVSDFFYYGYLVPEFENIDSMFLDSLQHIHDHFSPKYWESELKRFAKKWNLKVEWEWT